MSVVANDRIQVGEEIVQEIHSCFYVQLMGMGCSSHARPMKNNRRDMIGGEEEKEERQREKERERMGPGRATINTISGKGNGSRQGNYEYDIGEGMLGDMLVGCVAEQRTEKQ